MVGGLLSESGQLAACKEILAIVSKLNTVKVDPVTPGSTSDPSSSGSDVRTSGEARLVDFEFGGLPQKRIICSWPFFAFSTFSCPSPTKHMSPIDHKSTLAWLTSETSAVVCLGFAQTEGLGLSPYLHLN